VIMAPKKEPQIVHISQLKFDPKNARGRTERSSYMIRNSLESYGPLRSLVGQRKPNGEIVIKAGNGTLEEAGQIGIEEALIVNRKPNQLVVVVADDLDDKQWNEYAIADNRSSELSEWIPEVLAELDEEIDLREFWFEPELDQLLAKAGELPEMEGDRESSTQEIDVDAYEFDCKCPKCGFEFIQQKK